LEHLPSPSALSSLGYDIKRLLLVQGRILTAISCVQEITFVFANYFSERDANVRNNSVEVVRKDREDE
jgi:hypothetical protein